MNFILNKVIDTLSSNYKAPHYEKFEDYSRCFNKFDNPNVENDIFEIRHSDWVSLDFDSSKGANIHVSIIDVGIRTDVLFGPNGDLDKIHIDSPVIQPNLSQDGNYCWRSTAEGIIDDKESAASIKIQNGIVIESECVKKAVLMLTFANNPMVIGYDGKFHLFALLTFYQEITDKIR